MHKPLSEELRPKTLKEFIGQAHLFEEGAFLRQLFEERKALSLLLWGPPGCGKTTLARLYAKELNEPFFQLSAVSSSLADLKALLQKVENEPLIYPRLILFMDEVHRFNKSQQDFFLPFIEKGQLILIGATTENPSFSLNNALLSRLRVLTLKALPTQDLERLYERAESIKGPFNLTKEAKAFLIDQASGDGRYLLNLIENCSLKKQSRPLDVLDLKKLIQKRSALFDKVGDGHYNLISALHKSIRGSDPNAALYWLARLLKPLYIARRFIRMASEDIGLSDPMALDITLKAHQAYQVLGSPEGELALAQACVYLALSPKSNAVYLALKKAGDLAESTNYESPPMSILNAPTSLMKDLGYGQNYQYDHDQPHQFSGQNYFPDSFSSRPSFYEPLELGHEREMKKRLAYFNQLRAQKSQN